MDSMVQAQGAGGQMMESKRWASPGFPDTFNNMMCSGEFNDEDKKELHGRVQA